MSTIAGRQSRRKPTLTEAVEWIAVNDEDWNTDDIEFAESMLSVQLVADIFGSTPGHVARKVLNLRKRMARERRQA